MRPLVRDAGTHHAASSRQLYDDISMNRQRVEAQLPDTAKSHPDFVQGTHIMWLQCVHGWSSRGR